MTKVNDEEDVSVVSATLPNVTSRSRICHRPRGFWPETIKRCQNLQLNQAVKVRLLPSEVLAHFTSIARGVAKGMGFYLNVVYKHPYVYLWPDRMRGRVRPEDYNSKGATIFENEEEVR